MFLKGPKASQSKFFKRCNFILGFWPEEVPTKFSEKLNSDKPVFVTLVMFDFYSNPLLAQFLSSLHFNVPPTFHKTFCFVCNAWSNEAMFKWSWHHAYRRAILYEEQIIQTLPFNVTLRFDVKKIIFYDGVSSVFHGIFVVVNNYVDNTVLINLFLFTCKALVTTTQLKKNILWNR